MEIHGEQLFYSGYFETIGGQTRDKLVSINLSTGLFTSWNPTQGRISEAWTITNGQMYFIGLGG
jgi:hypothetical protein